MTQQSTSGSGPTRAESRVCRWRLHTMLTAAPLGAGTWKPPDPLAEESVRERPPTRGVLLSLKKDRNPAIGHMDEPGDTVLVEQASHRRTDTEREAVTAARQCERTRYPWTRKRFGRQVSSCVLYHDKNNKKASAPRPCRTECRSPTGVLLGPKPTRRGREAAAAPSPRARCVPSTPAVLFQRSSPLALYRPPTSVANS